MSRNVADNLGETLAERFAARFAALRAARSEAQARIDGGAFPAFPADARELREADWRVAAADAGVPAATPRVMADALSPDALGDIAAALTEGTRYVELPDVRTREEAGAWREILRAARDETGADTVGLRLPVDSIQAAFELEGIVYELRDHVVALAWHRNRYLLSFIRAFHSYPQLLLPDRGELKIGAPFLRAVGKHAQRIGERRGLAVDGFPEPLPDSVNPVEGADLLQISKGKITEEGIRENLRILLAWLPARDAGRTTVTIDDDQHDTSSAELALAQLRQWTHQVTGVLDIGHKVTLEVIEGQIADDAGEDMTGRLLQLIAEADA